MINTFYAVGFIWSNKMLIIKLYSFKYKVLCLRNFRRQIHWTIPIKLMNYCYGIHFSGYYPLSGWKRYSKFQRFCFLQSGSSNESNDIVITGDMVTARFWSPPITHLLQQHNGQLSTHEKTKILPKTLNNIPFCHIYLA